MIFTKSFALLISAMGISHAMATPVAAAEAPLQDSGLILLDQWLVEGVNITLYGIDEALEPSSAEINPLRRRCGSNQVSCYSTNKAPGNICSWVLNGVMYKHDTNLPRAGRSLCFESYDGKCCASWANDVSGLKVGHLYHAGWKTLTQCEPSGGGHLSGKARDVNLNGVCTTQCLSNRPDGCNNN